MLTTLGGVTSTTPTPDRRTRRILSVALTVGALVVALLVGLGVYGSLPRPYVQVKAEDVAPATNTGLGRAASAMRDLRYLCTEGKPARPEVRTLVCTGPEGWAEIEATTAGKVTYLALVSRADKLDPDRTVDVGRALVLGADLSQDAKIASRSVTDGKSDLSAGPWGSAVQGPEPYRLIFVGSDRPKAAAPATLGPATKLAARLAKQSCTTVAASPTPAASGAASPAPSGSPKPATPAVSQPPPGTPSTYPTTVCSSSNRLVTTTVAYEKSGDAVTRVTVTSSGLFAYGWTHTEAIRALREALTDLGKDATTVGDWVAANSSAEGTVLLGDLQIVLNPNLSRSVTSISVSRIP